MTTASAAPVVPTQVEDARRPVSRGPRVAFVLSQFPETHETFIVRELTVLEELGLDFVILSLKPCRDKVVQADARRFLDRTYYPRSAGKGGFPTALAARAVAASYRSIPWLSSPAQCAYVAWAARRFAGLSRNLGITHIHSHWATAPTSAAALMSRMLDIPYSFTAHAWDIYTGDGKLAAKARDARFVVTCTRANADFIRSELPTDIRDKIILNYHGIPDEVFLVPSRREERSDGALRIAAVGRLVETKGFEFLLHALGEAEFPFQLTIAGDGPLRGALEATCAGQRRLRGRVTFEGAVANERVFEILRGSDVFVMPSVIAASGDRDGIPNVLLEAMSVGLPVVASAVSGLPEAVMDCGTGILVPQRSPAAILSALRRLHADRAWAASLGLAGRELARERFSARANAAALYGLFMERAGGSAGGGLGNASAPRGRELQFR